MCQTVKNVLLWILLIAYPIVVVIAFAHPLFRLLRPFIIDGAYYNN